MIEVDVIKRDLDEIKESLEEFEGNIRGKRFLITGGAGFLGSWFCDVLNQFKAKIICVDNLSSGALANIKHLIKEKNFKFLRKDVKKFSFKGKVDYLVHMACIASPPLYQKYPLETLNTNVLGTINMLELAKKLRVKSFLFTSTSETYGDAKIFPTPEDYFGYVNPVGPRSVYDEGKRIAETYCYYYFRQFGLPVRIARIFNTYGPRLDIKSTSLYGRVIIKFIYQALNNLPITVYGDGKQTRSFCYITDQIIGLFKLLLKDSLDGKVINIGSDEEIRIIDLAKKVKKLTNSKSKIVFLPLPPDDPKRRRPDITKAKKLLGFKPMVKLDEGLKRTIEWTKEVVER